MAAALSVHGSGRRPLVADLRRRLHDHGDQARAGHAPDRPAQAEKTRTRAGARPGCGSAHSQRALMTSDSAKVIHIYTDGACKGNPGPAGWGALLRFGSQEKELFGGEAATTNNRMELMAVISALEALKPPCH